MSIDKKYYHNLDLVGNELKNARIYNLTTTQRLALGLTAPQKGFVVYDINLLSLYIWNGTTWTTAAGGSGTVTSVSAGTGMSFTTITGAGSVDIDTTKVPYIPAGFSAGFLKWNASTSSWIFDSNSYVPVGRNITINGVTQDLSTDRTWTISSGGLTHATASGTDTYTVTIPSVTAYTDGDAYLIRFTNGNTTSATLAINTLAAIPLYRNNDGPVIGGDILSGAEMLLVYNSTLSAFQCIGIAPNTLIAYVTNAEATTITKGQVVYAFGGTGNRMTVKLANNTSDATSAQTVGLVLSTSIAANQKGLIIVQGLLDGLSILPSSTWNDGDPVYLGSTAGSITKTKPYAPNHLVYLGVVTTASPGSSGRMYVRVQNGYELDELHNVQAQTPSVNDVLYYFGGNQWKTASISTILGYTPYNASNPAGYITLAALAGYATQTWVTSQGYQTAAQVTSAISSALTGYATQSWVTSQGYITSAALANYVQNTRTISTTSPLSGGGDLSANRTLSISQATTSTDGYLSSTDWNTFNAKEPAISTLPISKGGTNSNVALSNNRVMRSNAGAIVEAAAITPARALKSDANGIPTHFDTTTEPSLTELSYVKGVSSAIQTQLNGKQASSTNLTSLSGLSFASTSFVKMTGAGVFSLDTNTYLTSISGISAGGDLSGTYPNPTVASAAITLAKMANLGANTIIGNNTGSSATPLALSVSQVTAMLDLFSTTTTTKGLVPGSNGVGATYYLNANGGWSIPAGGGGGGGITISNPGANRLLTSDATGTVAQAQTNLTFDGQELKVTGQAASNIFAITSTSGTININWNNGNTQTITISGATTFTYSNVIPGAIYNLIVTVNALNSANNIAWASGTKWSNGVMGSFSTQAGAIDVVTIIAVGSTTNLLTVINKNFF